MIQYNAARFLAIIRKLDYCISLINLSCNQDDQVDHGVGETIQRELKKIEEDCKALSLGFVIAKILRIKDKLYSCTYGQLAKSFADLSERLYDEINDNLFMYVPKGKQQFYTDPHERFGLDVKNFPSATDEIEEAGKCYAAGRNTACVLHLMRVLETGLNALAKHLNVPYDSVNWEQITNKIPGKLDELEKLSPKPQNWKDDRKFYSEVGIHFKFIKDAYRNYAMHVHDRYDDSKALAIFNHVSAFMRHVATKLSE
jgi:hypothetical protein